MTPDAATAIQQYRLEPTDPPSKLVYWEFRAGEVVQAHACLTRTDAFATLQHNRTILPKTAQHLLDEGYVEPQPCDKREPPQWFRLSDKGREALLTARPVPDR